jgi:putative ABC transport system permease protein
VDTGEGGGIVRSARSVEAAAVKWLYIEELWRYLGRNRKRTFIAIAGIALGVLSLVLMSGISGAMRAKTLTELGKFGSRIIVVSPGELVVLGHKTAQIGTVHTLTQNDAHAIVQKIDGVASASVLKNGTLPVSTRRRAESSNVMGVEPSFVTLMDLELACGRGLLKEDEQKLRKVVVVGSRIASDFFGDSCPAGEKLTIADIPFRVVGVLAPRGSVGMEDYDRTILVPFSVMQRLLTPGDWLDGIFLLSAKVSKNDMVISQTSQLLKRRHGKKDFTVMGYEEASGTSAQMEHLFSILSVIVAAIAYSVGALGIVAIMALSMYERLIEIAIKRVAGATRRDLFFQFFFESTILSLAGALFGAVVALLLLVIIEIAAGWPLFFPFGTLLFSIFLSMLIGIVASLYPARRAMGLEPVKILKMYEES